MIDHPHFRRVRRQEFREYFQPSRIVICVVKDDEFSEWDFTTLCFCMHAGYKPRSMAVAVEKRHHSHKLLLKRDKFVLAVPGRALVHETLYCGLHSGRDVDKAAVLKLRLFLARHDATPWLADAIANIDLTKTAVLDAGDHDIIVGHVNGYSVNDGADGACLVSVGAKHAGYEILARNGIHRIAVIAGADTDAS